MKHQVVMGYSESVSFIFIQFILIYFLNSSEGLAGQIFTRYQCTLLFSWCMYYQFVHQTLRQSCRSCRLALPTSDLLKQDGTMVELEPRDKRDEIQRNFQ